ncbi:zonadhesin [Xenopus laevis]|uniref:Zonadhesin n=2 Tax=Xenopus laevis TaxID=8355 RepID=A0A8J0TCX9_XENLA|nr:zonadhesin [Xenopus laevis]
MTLQRILVLLLVATTMESATEADETTTEASPKAMMMTDPGSESTPEKFTSAALCPIGAEWSNCVECNSDCATLYMVCTEGCREGCKCIGPGYVFYEGSCIPASNCPTPAETTTFTISDTIETTMETTQETSPSESTTTETTTTDWPASTTSTTANRFTTGSWTTVTPPCY